MEIKKERWFNNQKKKYFDFMEDRRIDRMKEQSKHWMNCKVKGLVGRFKNKAYKT